MRLNREREHTFLSFFEIHPSFFLFIEQSCSFLDRFFFVPNHSKDMSECETMFIGTVGEKVRSRCLEFVLVSLFSARCSGSLGHAATLSAADRHESTVDHCRWIRWLVGLRLAPDGKGEANSRKREANDSF